MDGGGYVKIKSSKSLVQSWQYDSAVFEVGKSRAGMGNERAVRVDCGRNVGRVLYFAEAEP